MSELEKFILALEPLGLSSRDRAIAILWWQGRVDPSYAATARDLCGAIEASGYPPQNSSRLDTQLSTAPSLVMRVSKTKAWKVHPRGRAKLDESYSSMLGKPKPADPSDSVLSRGLFDGTRGYLQKVVLQINGSYDAQLYDCCAVMCRRLLETLIIEVYEADTRAAAIKGRDGHFLQFSELLRAISSDPAFNLGRNTQRGLEDFKRLGDLSAHNRRFNAQKSDIDRIRDGLRVSSEELLHLAQLI